MKADHTYQFVEGEYMTAEEYDHFLLDTTDFMMRRYWPRVCGGLKGFEKLPPLHNIISYYMGIPAGFGAFSMPEVIEALEVLKKAGQESARIGAYARKYGEKSREAGYPLQVGAISQAPYDTLGDFFRGTKGVMLDMYRRPEKVIKACEHILPFMIEMAVNGYKVSGSHDMSVSALNTSSYTGGNCTVSCHNGFPVQWTSTVTCTSCHTALPQ